MSLHVFLVLSLVQLPFSSSQTFYLPFSGDAVLIEAWGADSLRNPDDFKTKLLLYTQTLTEDELSLIV